MANRTLAQPTKRDLISAGVSFPYTFPFYFSADIRDLATTTTRSIANFGGRVIANFTGRDLQ